MLISYTQNRSWYVCSTHIHTRVHIRVHNRIYRVIDKIQNSMFRRIFDFLLWALADVNKSIFALFECNELPIRFGSQTECYFLISDRAWPLHSQLILENGLRTKWNRNINITNHTLIYDFESTLCRITRSAVSRKCRKQINVNLKQIVKRNHKLGAQMNSLGLWAGVSAVFCSGKSMLREC